MQWCSANNGCCYTWDVIFNQGAHDAWEIIMNPPGLLKIQASDNWAMLIPFAFAISSTRLMISWVGRLSAVYPFRNGSVSVLFVASVKGLQRSPRAIGDQGIEATLNHCEATMSWRGRGISRHIHWGLETFHALLHGRRGCNDFALIWTAWVCYWWRSLHSWGVKSRCKRPTERTLHRRNWNIVLSTTNIENSSIRCVHCQA